MVDLDSKNKKALGKIVISVETVLNEAVIILQRVVYFHADLVIELLFPVILSGILSLALMLIFNNDTLEKLNRTKSFILVLSIICSKITYDITIFVLMKYKWKKAVLTLIGLECIIIITIDICVRFILLIIDISTIYAIDLVFLILIFWNYLCYGIMSMMWNMPTEGKQWFIIILAANLSFIMIKIIHPQIIWVFILILSLIDFLWELIPYFRITETEFTNDLDVRLKYALMYTTLPMTSSSIMHDSSIANTSENNIFECYKNEDKDFYIFDDFNTFTTNNFIGSTNDTINKYNSLDRNTSALSQPSYSHHKRLPKELRTYGLREIKLLQNKCIKRIKSGVQIPVSNLLMYNLLFAVVGSRQNALALYYSFLCTFFCILIKTIFHIHLEKSFPNQFFSLFLIYTITTCVTAFVTTHNEKNFLNSIYP